MIEKKCSTKYVKGEEAEMDNVLQDEKKNG
jgi:hypothetical protein